MKINKLKRLATIISCLIISLWSETQCMDGTSDIRDSLENKIGKHATVMEMNIDNNTKNSYHLNSISRNDWIELSQYIYDYLSNIDSPITVEKNPSGFYRINNIPLSQKFKNLGGMSFNKIRVHYWPTDFSNKIEGETIHDHPNVFQTYLVQGSYNHESFVQTSCIENLSKYYVTSVQKPGNNYIQRNNTVCLLSDGGKEVYAGETHLLPIEFIHRVVKYFPGTISINMIHDHPTNRNDHYNLYSLQTLLGEDVKEKMYATPELSREVVCVIKDALNYNSLMDTSPAISSKFCNSTNVLPPTNAEVDSNAIHLSSPNIENLEMTAFYSSLQGGIVSFLKGAFKDFMIINDWCTLDTAEYLASALSAVPLSYYQGSYLPLIISTVEHPMLKFINISPNVTIGGIVAANVAMNCYFAEDYSSLLTPISNLAVSFVSGYVGSWIGTNLWNRLSRTIVSNPAY
ncbi:MAG: hypothetical protein K0M45_03145 [Candidatus Paracaedibacteraceae bacterium]|nr:hypothetical protein [Candidatus Paracaedibacteraceae bacterium]